jgi:hypothetical protein
MLIIKYYAQYILEVHKKLALILEIYFDIQ